MSTLAAPSVTLPEQAPKLLAHIAGYVGHRTVTIGLRHGLIAALDEGGSTTPAELADRLDLDPFYVGVWCRSALACGICELDPDRRGDDVAPGPDDPARQEARSASAPPEPASRESVSLESRYVLAPHMGTLLLEADHPAFVGGVFTVLEQREVFDRFGEVLGTGERLWWDGCSPEWIAGVAATGMPFYRRLAPAGLSRVPGLGDALDAGCRILDTACGSGGGLVHLARSYPRCTIVGVDGDRLSVDRARAAVRAVGVADRVEVVHAPLEEFHLDEPSALVVNNISMHECRDVDRATANIRSALEPGGWFVISDFPFPTAASGLRSAPGQVMCGIQFFEAQIDDQLLPRETYDDLLARHGFVDIGHVDISPLHALTYGRAPRIRA